MLNTFSESVYVRGSGFRLLVLVGNANNRTPTQKMLYSNFVVGVRGSDALLCVATAGVQSATRIMSPKLL